MKKIAAFISALLLLLPVSANAYGDDSMEYVSSKEYYKAIIEKEIKYIRSLTVSCGAIGMFAPEVHDYSGLYFTTVCGIEPQEYLTWKSVRVVPYFSDAAVMGIIKCAAASGNTDGKDIVLDYINWYIAHMNTAESDLSGVAGTVYDYYIFESNDGRTVEVTQHDAYSQKYPTGNPYDYDSTDSYAAMFLEILYEYANVFDNRFLDDKRETVDTLVNVIMATYIDSLDLTIAKPTYPECYMMDNCEVFCGLESAAGIYGDYYGDSEMHDYCTRYAEKVKNAILGRMWNDEGGYFMAAVSDRGHDSYGGDLSVFYPQASCQLFPVIFGVLEHDDERAIAVYERFKSDFCINGEDGKNWTTFDVNGVDYPWAILLRAVVAMGDYKTASEYITVMNRRFINVRHSYPYYNAESGNILMAVAALYSLTDEPDESSSDETDCPPEASAEENTSLTADDENCKSVLPWVIGGAAAVTAAVVAALLAKGKRTTRKNSKERD